MYVIYISDSVHEGYYKDTSFGDVICTSSSSNAMHYSTMSDAQKSVDYLINIKDISPSAISIESD